MTFFKNLVRKPSPSHFINFVHLVLKSTHDELSTHMFRFPVDIHKKSAEVFLKSKKNELKYAFMTFQTSVTGHAFMSGFVKSHAFTTGVVTGHAFMTGVVKGHAFMIGVIISPIFMTLVVKSHAFITGVLVKL